MPATTYTSPEIHLDALDHHFSRADIEFHDVDHSGASFEARVFLNNPGADESTERSPLSGYVGSFHIFGHGGCFGDVGHCDVEPWRPYDPRPAHPLTPARKVVIATDAMRRAMEQSGTATVTVVPVVSSTTPRAGTEDVLKLEQVQMATYR
jgi:hypothetical protein